MEHIQWRPRLWIEGTRGLTCEQRGVYFELINQMYAIGGPLPLDVAWLQGLCGIPDVRTFRRLFLLLVDAGKLQLELKDGTPIADAGPVKEAMKGRSKPGSVVQIHCTSDALPTHFRRTSDALPGHFDVYVSAKRVRSELDRAQIAIDVRANARAKRSKNNALPFTAVDTAVGARDAIREEKRREENTPLPQDERSQGREAEPDQTAPPADPTQWQDLQAGLKSVGKPKPPTASPRARGVNPRALGTNPRAVADPPPPPIAMPDPATDWGRVCERIRLEIGDAAYRVAIAPLEPTGPPNGVLKLRAPNAFVRDYVVANHAQALGRLAGIGVEVIADA